jgi:DNA repair protein RAD16
VDDSSITVLTPEQLKERKAERKRRAEAKAEARKPLEKMVKEEIKRLGRKLTQGEKNACSLKVHHPDLVDVWGDLQNRVKVIKPVTMEAHPSLKLTLLPFQKESLYWMRKQEEGPWKGGMLADESELLRTGTRISLITVSPLPVGM